MAHWTKEQEEAINARNCNLLVAAAAGSGKTSVLVERIIRLLLNDRVDIDRMLIVTFTQAAAGEMREKINSALFKELGKGKEDAHLRRQLYLLNRSSISTIHAFCSEVVRQHFHLLNIDPHFRIADSSESELIKMEALKELLDEEYEKGHETFLRLPEVFSSNKDDKALEALVLRLHSFIQSHPRPAKWLEEKIAGLALDEDDWERNPWEVELVRQIKIELSAARDILNQAAKLCNKACGPRGYLGAVASDLEWVELLLGIAEQGFPSLYSCLQQMSFTRLGRVSRDADEGLKQQVKDLRDESKRIINNIGAMPARDPLASMQDLNEIYPVMKSLGELVEAFTKIYQEKKTEKGLLDFNDLEHLALHALSHEAIAREYRDYYSYIFVDEYQDSNLVQETILNYIKREDNLFMVGDVKQSIYRFRLADPTLFLEKQGNFSRQGDAVNRRIDLNRNFRSHPEILDLVNYIFRHLMTKELGEMDYDENSFLYPGSSSGQEPGEEEKAEAQPKMKQEDAIGSRVEMYILENNPNSYVQTEEDTTDEWGTLDETKKNMIEQLLEMDNTEMEALLIAQKIRQIIGKEIYDSKLRCRRKLEYRDIVVLLRATRNSAGVYLEQMNAEGIPVYADAGSGYFDTLEINIFVNLLRLIDNKRQDIPLISVMRSPIGGFTLDDFIQIRSGLPACNEKPSPSFYESVERYIEEKNDDLKDRLLLFIESLREWELESRIMNLDEFIGKLYLDTGYYYYSGAMPGGGQRQANLRLLLHRAKEFQKSSFKGLFNFINYIEKISSSGSDMGNACIIGENDNVVRVMSIHKSKGLEFPVVILGGLGKKFNIRDSKESVLLHQKLGIGPRYVNTQLRTYRDTIARLAIKERIKKENLAEEMRILYVACTRAREKLIMVGTTRRLNYAWRRWIKPANPYNQSRAGNYLDWLIPIILRHQEEGQCLREMAGGEWEGEILWDDKSRWRIHFINPGQLSTEEIKKKQSRSDWEKVLKEGGCPHPSPEDEEIRKRLNWKYPHKEAERIPAKLSVSQLGKMKTGSIGDGASNSFLTRVPIIREGEEKRKTLFSPLEKGSIIHLLMQNIDYKRVGHKDSIKKQLAEMVNKEILTPEQSAAVEINEIRRFFQTELGQRIVQAKRLFREAPFVLPLPANEVFPGIDSREKLLIQGIIDLYFYEGEDIVMLDYKSDRVRHKSEEEAIAPYRVQIKFYRKALEKITGKRVKESYLYYFDLNRALRV